MNRIVRQLIMSMLSLNDKQLQKVFLPNLKFHSVHCSVWLQHVVIMHPSAAVSHSEFSGILLGIMNTRRRSQNAHKFFLQVTHRLGFPLQCLGRQFLLITQTFTTAASFFCLFNRTFTGRRSNTRRRLFAMTDSPTVSFAGLRICYSNITYFSSSSRLTLSNCTMSAFG